MIGGGRPAIRKALYMGALTATRHNPVLSATYRNPVARGKPKKQALVAVMRKLLIHLNSIMAKLLKAPPGENPLPT